MKEILALHLLWRGLPSVQKFIFSYIPSEMVPTTYGIDTLQQNQLMGNNQLNHERDFSDQSLDLDIGAMQVPFTEVKELLHAICRACHPNATLNDLIKMTNMLLANEPTKDYYGQLDVFKLICSSVSAWAEPSMLSEHILRHEEALNLRDLSFLSIVPVHFKTSGTEKREPSPGGGQSPPPQDKSTLVEITVRDSFFTQLVEAVLHDEAPRPLLPFDKVLIARIGLLRKVPIHLSDYIEPILYHPYDSVYDIMWCEAHRMPYGSSDIPSYLPTENFIDWFSFVYRALYQNALRYSASIIGEKIFWSFVGRNGYMSLNEFRLACFDVAKRFGKINCDPKFFYQQLHHLLVETRGLTPSNENGGSSVGYHLLESTVTLPNSTMLPSLDTFFIPDELDTEQIEYIRMRKDSFNRILIVGKALVGKSTLASVLASQLNLVNLDVVQLAISILRTPNHPLNTILNGHIKREQPISLNLQAQIINYFIKNPATQHQGYVFGDIPPITEESLESVKLFLEESGIAEFLPRSIIRIECPNELYENWFRIIKALQLGKKLPDILKEDDLMLSSHSSSLNEVLSRVSSNKLDTSGSLDISQLPQSLENMDPTDVLTQSSSKESVFKPFSSITENPSQVEKQVVDNSGTIDEKNFPLENSSENHRSLSSGSSQRSEEEDEKNSSSAVELLIKLISAGRFKARPGTELYLPDRLPIFEPIQRLCEVLRRNIQVDITSNVEENSSYIIDTLGLLPSIIPDEHDIDEALKDFPTDTEESEALISDRKRSMLLENIDLRFSKWNTYCPVTYADHSLLLEGQWLYSCTYRGLIYLFRSELALHRFKASPDTFLNPDKITPLREAILLLPERFDTFQGIDTNSMLNEIASNLHLTLLTFDEYVQKWKSYSRDFQERVQLRMQRELYDTEELKRRKQRLENRLKLSTKKKPPEGSKGGVKIGKDGRRMKYVQILDNVTEQPEAVDFPTQADEKDRAVIDGKLKRDWCGPVLISCIPPFSTEVMERFYKLNLLPQKVVVVRRRPSLLTYITMPQQLSVENLSDSFSLNEGQFSQMDEDLLSSIGLPAPFSGDSLDFLRRHMGLMSTIDQTELPEVSTAENSSSQPPFSVDKISESGESNEIKSSITAVSERFNQFLASMVQIFRARKSLSNDIASLSPISTDALTVSQEDEEREKGEVLSDNSNISDSLLTENDWNCLANMERPFSSDFSWKTTVFIVRCPPNNATSTWLSNEICRLCNPFCDYAHRADGNEHIDLLTEIQSERESELLEAFERTQKEIIPMSLNPSPPRMGGFLHTGYPVEYRFGPCGRYCPVTLKKNEWLVEGDVDYCAIFRGKWYLCRNEQCLELFLQDPAQFLNDLIIPPLRVWISGKREDYEPLFSQIAQTSKLSWFIPVEAFYKEVLQLGSQPGGGYLSDVFGGGFIPEQWVDDSKLQESVSVHKDSNYYSSFHEAMLYHRLLQQMDQERAQIMRLKDAAEIFLQKYESNLISGGSVSEENFPSFEDELSDEALDALRAATFFTLESDELYIERRTRHVHRIGIFLMNAEPFRTHGMLFLTEYLSEDAIHFFDEYQVIPEVIVQFSTSEQEHMKSISLSSGPSLSKPQEKRLSGTQETDNLDNNELSIRQLWDARLQELQAWRQRTIGRSRPSVSPASISPSGAALGSLSHNTVYPSEIGNHNMESAKHNPYNFSALENVASHIVIFGSLNDMASTYRIPMLTIHTEQELPMQSDEWELKLASRLSNRKILFNPVQRMEYGEAMEKIRRGGMYYSRFHRQNIVEIFKRRSYHLIPPIFAAEKITDDDIFPFITLTSNDRPTTILSAISKLPNIEEVVTKLLEMAKKDISPSWNQNSKNLDNSSVQEQIDREENQYTLGENDGYEGKYRMSEGMLDDDDEENEEEEEDEEQLEELYRMKERWVANQQNPVVLRFGSYIFFAQEETEAEEFQRDPLLYFTQPDFSIFCGSHMDDAPLVFFLYTPSFSPNAPSKMVENVNYPVKAQITLGERISSHINAIYLDISTLLKWAMLSPICHVWWKKIRPVFHLGAFPPLSLICTLLRVRLGCTDVRKAKKVIVENFPFPFFSTEAIGKTDNHPETHLEEEIAQWLDKCLPRIYETDTPWPYYIINTDSLNTWAEPLGENSSYSMIFKNYATSLSNSTEMVSSNTVSISSFGIVMDLFDIIRCRREWYRSITNGYPAALWKTCTPKQSILSCLSAAKWYCLSHWVTQHKLVDLRSMLRYLVTYKNICYYLCGPEELESFLVEPEAWLPSPFDAVFTEIQDQESPSNLPTTDTTALQENVEVERHASGDEDDSFIKGFPKLIPRQVDPSNLEFEVNSFHWDGKTYALNGYCAVTLFETRFHQGIRGEIEPITCKGSPDWIAYYDDQYYTFKDESAFKKFMESPWNYVKYSVTPFSWKDIPAADAEKIDPKSLFIHKNMYLEVAEGLKAVTQARPKHPNLSPEDSARVYLGLHLKSLSKGSSDISNYFQERFSLFHKVSTNYHSVIPEKK